MVLTNLDAGHSNPGVIAHVVAGLVNPALTVPKLEAIADNQPELAEQLWCYPEWGGQFSH